MRRLLFGIGFLACAAMCTPVPMTAQEKKAPEKKKAEKPAAFTQASEAGPDFAIQGEYEAEVLRGAEKKKIGVQVIAKGDGKFEGRFYSDGLPGAGWNETEAFTWKTKADGGKVAIIANIRGVEEDLGNIEAGKIRLNGPNGETTELKKVERKSPTEGAKAPEGAIVLFGGIDDISKWNGGKIKELADGKYLDVGCKTKQAFTNYKLHVEFRLPFMPKAGGQGRGNSGVYMQDRYEVQVLDSFGLKGLNNECGGVYTIAAPKLNMCLPPLQWQTYDIDFTAAKYDGDKKVKNAVITAKHNGVTIHDHQEIAKETGGGQKEANTPGPIQLQNHGDPVVFRNIWILETK